VKEGGGCFGKDPPMKNPKTLVGEESLGKKKKKGLVEKHKRIQTKGEEGRLRQPTTKT